MRKISEVLRLRAEGLSTRAIAASVGAGRSTVFEYLARAEEAGIAWPLPEGVDDAALEARLFPPPEAVAASTRPVPEWRQVHREMKARKHVTLRLLWLEWRQDQPDGWGYSQFCWHYQQWLAGQDVVMRLSYPAGERMFVDFSGDKAAWVDPASGEARQAEVFVAVLGGSGMLYVEATRGQDLGSWLEAHMHAFDAYGGVAAVTVPDNLRSGVTKACWYDPELNPSYLELARHYNTVVLPTRVAHPKDKAAVEAGVLTVERWVLAPLRHRRFFGLAELNEAIGERVEWVNNRPFRGEPASRAELFAELERPALRPLPERRFELAAWKKVTVNIDYHVEFDRRFYSVPFTLVRQRLELRATASTVEVYKAGRRVASHAREYGRRRYVTDPEHMPASHRAHLEWTPSRLIRWAATVGPATAELVEKILESRPHPEHAYRACLGLMNLAKRYGNERVGAACERALAAGAISYSSVKSILAENLDRLALPEPTAAPTPPEHDNLRGAHYWAGGDDDGDSGENSSREEVSR
ncbi:MAG: IS21 family transposase [Acidimicrobiales bacterium]